MADIFYPCCCLTDHSDEMNAYLDGQTCNSELTSKYDELPTACQEKRCYNYLILDSKKLAIDTNPPESSHLSFTYLAGSGYFKKFVSAVIYVGRGTQKDGDVRHQTSHDHIGEAHKSNRKV